MGQQTSRVLVTGGAGFIGSQLVTRFIRDGYRVCVLDDLSSGTRESVPADAIFRHVSLEQTEDVRAVFDEFRPEIVSHHAAQASVTGSLNDPGIDLPANFSGLFNILQSCLEFGVQRFIFPSSCSVYGESPRPAKETDQLTPLSPYGISKLAGEHYVRWASERGHLQTIILRYANVYGPGQSPERPCGVVSIFTQRVIDKLPVVVYGDGRTVRDYVFVDDVVDAHMLATGYRDSASRSVVLNIGSGRGTELVELLRIIESLTVGPATVPLKIDRKPFRRGEAWACLLSVREARKAIGWTPSTELRYGVERVVDWLTDSVSRSQRSED